MKFHHKKTGLRSCLLFTFAVAIFFTVSVSCGDDEPDRSGYNQGGSNHNPTGPSGEEDPDSPDDPGATETDRSPIVGIWAEEGTGITHEFGENGEYARYCTSPENTGEETLSGTYVYSDIKSWLYLTIIEKGSTYAVEYRCVIAGMQMTLYDASGKKTILHKS